MANKEKMNAEACELKDEECKACEDKAEDLDKPEEAEEELVAKEEENADDDMANKYVRLMAEFQNYKKRVSKEKDDLRSYANENLVLSLLEVLDNFERALQHEVKPYSSTATITLHKRMSTFLYEGHHFMQ